MEYNAAYRRRIQANGYVKKLEHIIEQSSPKDAEKLFHKINRILWKASDKCKFFGEDHVLADEKGDDDDKVVEGNEDDEQIEAMERKFGCFAVAHHYCSVCGKNGYLFSPNLDAEGDDLERYILHLNWPLEESTCCQIPSSKKRPILVNRVPTMGVLTTSGLKV